MKRYILLCLLIVISASVGFSQATRKQFAYEQREGDTRPKPNLAPNPFPRGEGAGVGSKAKGGWQPNGIAVCDTGAPWLPKIVSDGNSGAIICWTERYRADSLDDDYDIYAQRVDSGGNKVWQLNGVPVCSLTVNNAWYPAMISDGRGGAIIAWEEWGRDSIGYTRVFAQRLDSLGNRLWPENGVLVCNQMSGYVELCSDGHGGAIIVYSDGRNEATTSDDIYAQRIDSAGNTLWAVDGVPVCTADSIQFWPHICSNNNSGAIITWEEDYRNNGTTGEDVYAQMLDSLGNAQWIINGDTICVKPGLQRGRNPIANLLGGGLFSWWAFSDTNLAYAQSLNSIGNKQWGGVGKITKLRGNLCEDMRGGGILTSSITIQRINSDGNICWGTGVNLYPDSGGHYDSCEDGEGGLITICDKLRNNPNYADQYAQKVDSSGNIIWKSTGLPVCTLQMRYETYPQITSDGLGGAICTWFGSQWHMEFYDNVYVQRIYSDGTPGGVTGEPIQISDFKNQNIKCYPNPFFSKTKISYQQSSPAKIKISVYNIAGQLVKILANAEQDAGSYMVLWDGRDDNGHQMSSGIYFINYNTLNINTTTKTIKLK